MGLADWTQLGSAFFAAVAAVAAWAAVMQVRAERRASQIPDLYIEVIEKVPTGEIEVQLMNAGGPAKKVNFVVVEGGTAAIGHPPPSSFMRSGETRLLKTGLTGAGPDFHAIGVVMGMDLAGRFVYATTVGGKTRKWRLRPTWLSRAELSDQWIFRQLYPDAPDPVNLPIVTYTLEERYF